MGNLSTVCTLSLFILVITSLELDANKDISFDYMKFTQEYPPAICENGNLRKYMHGLGQSCVIGKNVTTWTIHGLWPTKNHTFGPNFCNDTYKFDPETIKSLLPQLEKYWPNVFAQTKPTGFWEHEWTKHGTCALSIPELSSEFKFFSYVLKLNQQYNLSRDFASAGIVPSDIKTYKVDEIRAALKKYYNPPFSCIKDKASGKQYIGQLSICLNKAFQPIDCSNESKGKLNENLISCDQNAPVYYLPFRSI